ncbi:hypothetical protein D9M69_524730 [compost metagenome]
MNAWAALPRLAMNRSYDWRPDAATEEGPPPAGEGLPEARRVLLRPPEQVGAPGHVSGRGAGGLCTENEGRKHRRRHAQAHRRRAEAAQNQAQAQHPRSVRGRWAAPEGDPRRVRTAPGQVEARRGHQKQHGRHSEHGQPGGQLPAHRLHLRRRVAADGQQPLHRDSPFRREEARPLPDGCRAGFNSGCIYREYAGDLPDGLPHRATDQRCSQHQAGRYQR